MVVRSGQGSVFLGPHVDARHIAYSPDGTYALIWRHDSGEGAKMSET